MITRFEKFSLVISELHKQIVRISAEEMRKYGLQGPSARILLTLLKKGPQTAAALARNVDKNKAEISRVIVELEKKGLVEKADSKTNYRVKIKLTEKGSETAESIKASAISAVSHASLGLSDEDREGMYDCLDHIAKNLQTFTPQDL